LQDPCINTLNINVNYHILIKFLSAQQNSTYLSIQHFKYLNYTYYSQIFLSAVAYCTHAEKPLHNENLGWLLQRVSLTTTQIILQTWGLLMCKTWWCPWNKFLHKKCGHTHACTHTHKTKQNIIWNSEDQTYIHYLLQTVLKHNGMWKENKSHRSFKMLKISIFYFKTQWWFLIFTVFFF
jgi:hypothetical protein